MKIDAAWQLPGKETSAPDLSTKLYDLQKDPAHLCPIDEPDVEGVLEDQLVRLMRECDAPEEQFYHRSNFSNPLLLPIEPWRPDP